MFQTPDIVSTRQASNKRLIRDAINGRAQLLKLAVATFAAAETSSLATSLRTDEPPIFSEEPSREEPMNLEILAETEGFEPSIRG